MAEQEEVFTVRWSEVDGEWVATVSTRPSLSWLAGNPTKALAGLVRVMEAL